MEKTNKYYGIIEGLIKANKKYPGCESVLENIIDDVYAHSEVIINSISNENVIIAYLEKVVATSIITVPKKMGISNHKTVDKALVDKMINISSSSVIDEIKAPKSTSPKLEPENTVKTIQKTPAEELSLIPDDNNTPNNLATYSASDESEFDSSETTIAEVPEIVEDKYEDYTEVTNSEDSITSETEVIESVEENIPEASEFNPVSEIENIEIPDFEEEITEFDSGNTEELNHESIESIDVLKFAESPEEPSQLLPEQAEEPEDLEVIDFNNVEPDTGIEEPEFTTDISDTTADTTADATDIVDFNEISPEFENESGLENENSTLDYEDTVIDLDEIGTESENTPSEPADEPVVSETFEISDYEITPTEESNNNEPEIILETAGPEINTESDIIEDLSINTEETNNIHDDEVIEPLNSVEEDDLQDINYDTELEPVLDQSETLSLEFEDASGADLLVEDSPLEELVPEENLSEELPINDNTLDLAEPDSPIDLGFEQTNNPDLAYSAETGKSSISADYEKFSYTPEFEPDDIDTESIIKEIAALNHKRPDLNILNVYDLKFKEKLPVSQIASQLDMSENAVVESLNEIIAIV